MKIVLAGFMGTGKTSVGRELSDKLGYPFIDTDVLIEEREGMPISLIFKNKGEDHFRRIESEIVAEISKKKNVVIATGGGVIKNRQNVDNLRRRGVILCLTAGPEIILKRVMLEGGKRPLLDVEEPLNEIKKLLAEREEFYKQADAFIKTDFITPDETADEIISLLGLETESVNVGLDDRSYEIVIGHDLLSKLGLRIKEFRPSKVAIISNETVFPLYKDTVLASLKEHGIMPEVFLMPDGEKHKGLEWANRMYGNLLAARFDRSSLILALGGGVAGDLTGFVAATYMRGIRFIQVPTTLLSQVDSSVGGKTGVNHPLGKNMIGAFYQPSLVLIDVDTLKTLPKREFAAGMAEVIKYGVIADRELFDYLKNKREDILSLGESIIHLVKRSCEIKADVVSKDERETGLRAILNFGHTIGHAIETATGYKMYLHGEALAIGMRYAADIAVRKGIFDKGLAVQVKALIESYNLPVDLPLGVPVSDIINAVKVDKKAKAGKVIFILPESIGSVRIADDVDEGLIREALEG
ncbi:MAG: 3-dehydroquinate synthase [Nitrospirae bacterium]|nr:3-dehydroquinate synthase [Nitrospirota bacterium]